MKLKNRTPYCCPISVESIAIQIDFIGVFGEHARLFESGFPAYGGAIGDQGSPQRHRGHREGEPFFVYREIPIDENNLAQGG